MMNAAWHCHILSTAAFLAEACNHTVCPSQYDRLTIWGQILIRQVLKEKHEDISEKPESGCYIYGLFLEGAKWDEERMMLAESSPKELFVTFPLFWFMPETLRIKPTEGKTCYAGS